MEELYKQSFDQHFHKLYSYAYTIVKDADEAKDVVQSAFIKLWEKREQVNMETSARAYLYTTVHNLALNLIRNSKTRNSHHLQMVTKESMEYSIATEEKESIGLIKKAIDDLPPRCKEVFCKSRYEGRKYAEIATELNISIKTVEVQMGRALKILREQLADLISILIIQLLLNIQQL